MLVSSVVRDSMAQSAIRFKDRGLHRLKGVPERWRLYGVERDAPATGRPPVTRKIVKKITRRRRSA